MRSVVLGLVVACNVSPDVVAIAADQNDGPSKSEVNEPAKKAATCSSATTIAVATKRGAQHQIDLETLERLAASECPGAEAAPIAMRRSGAVWTIADGTLAVAEPGGTCKRFDAPVTGEAMAFVWDPDLETEMLYVLVSGVLVVINPTTLARTPIGTVRLEDVRNLAGTSDGRLIAFAGEAPVTIASISRSNGAVEKAWQVEPADESRFAGGVVTERGVSLIFGVGLYALDPTTLDLAFDATLSPDDLYAASAAPCATFGK